MREIKFRGKSYDEWVYGMLMRTNDFDTEHGEDWEYTIQTDEKEMGEYNRYFITDSNTIGEYAGLKDKNGVEIYEGDYLERKFDITTSGVVEFRRGVFGVRGKDGKFREMNLLTDEVIGNIYDNPELIEKEGK